MEKPRRLRTRFLDLSSSSCSTSWTELILRLSVRTASMDRCLRSYRSYSRGKDDDLVIFSDWVLSSSKAICYHSSAKVIRPDVPISRRSASPAPPTLTKSLNDLSLIPMFFTGSNSVGP